MDESKDSELKKALKKFEDDYDVLIATAKKVGMVLAESKDSDKIEEREFQAKLAALQTDVQVWLSLLIGFMAVFVSLLVYSGQMLFTLPNLSEMLRNSFIVSIGISIVGLALVTAICSKKMIEKRNQIEKLPIKG